jgi:hypothetical protein
LVRFGFDDLGLHRISAVWRAEKILGKCLVCRDGAAWLSVLDEKVES